MEVCSWNLQNNVLDHQSHKGQFLKLQEFQLSLLNLYVFNGFKQLVFNIIFYYPLILFNILWLHSSSSAPSEFILDPCHPFPPLPTLCIFFILTTYQVQLMLSLYAWVQSRLLEKSQPNRHHILGETVSPSRCHQESVALKHRDLWKPIFLS